MRARHIAFARTRAHTHIKRRGGRARPAGMAHSAPHTRTLVDQRDHALDGTNQSADCCNGDKHKHHAEEAVVLASDAVAHNAAVVIKPLHAEPTQAAVDRPGLAPVLARETPLVLDAVDDFLGRRDAGPKLVLEQHVIIRLAPRIRGITDAPDTPGAKPLLMVVDLQDDKSYYMEEVDTVTVAAVKDFVAKFHSKKLEKKKLNF